MQKYGIWGLLSNVVALTSDNANAAKALSYALREGGHVPKCCVVTGCSVHGLELVHKAAVNEVADAGTGKSIVVMCNNVKMLGQIAKNFTFVCFFLYSNAADIVKKVRKLMAHTKRSRKFLKRVLIKVQINDALIRAEVAERLATFKNSTRGHADEMTENIAVRQVDPTEVQAGEGALQILIYFCRFL